MRQRTLFHSMSSAIHICSFGVFDFFGVDMLFIFIASIIIIIITMLSNSNWIPIWHSNISTYHVTRFLLQTHVHYLSISLSLALSIEYYSCMCGNGH